RRLPQPMSPYAPAQRYETRRRPQELRYLQHEPDRASTPPLILHLELPKEGVLPTGPQDSTQCSEKPLTPSLQPYSGRVRVRTTTRKTGGNFYERLFGTRKIKCRASPGAPI